VTVEPGAVIDLSSWQRIYSALLEFIPAVSVTLIGDPAKEIHVVAFSPIHDGLLRIVEGLAGTRLAVAY
jgi:hypothetical protein